MRKFVKTVAVLALAVSVLSTSAFAAVDGTIKGANGTYTADITSDVAGEQITLLAVDASAVDKDDVKGTYLANVTDASILYIDQNATGDFVNFQVKGDDIAGKEVFFFAGSASSSEAKYLGSKANYKVVIEAKPASVEVGQEVELTAAITGGTYTGAIDWEASNGATLSDESSNGATFTAAAEGTYTVKLALTDANVESNEVTIIVTAPSFKVNATQAAFVETAPGEEGADAEAQNGLGVALTLTAPKAFTKMIWVLVAEDGTRYYSPAQNITGVAEGSALTVAAAFANGNGTTKAVVDVKKVDAIFTVDETEETTFFTDYDADHNKKDTTSQN
jgi:hypothetical protein